MLGSMTESVYCVKYIIAEKLLGRVGKALDAEADGDAVMWLEDYIGAYMALCQSETMCKCPTREEFPHDIGDQ